MFGICDKCKKSFETVGEANNCPLCGAPVGKQWKQTETVRRSSATITIGNKKFEAKTKEELVEKIRAATDLPPEIKKVIIEKLGGKP